MRNKNILLMIVMMLCVAVTPAFAMQVEFIPEYQTYKPVGWNTFVGVPIDDSSSGFMLELFDDGLGNGQLVQLNSVDGTNSYWWALVSAVNSSLTSVHQTNPTPPDLDFFLQCNGVGGWVNFTSSPANYTWNSGYNIFRLTWNVEEWVPQCDLESCPTGRELFALQGNCYIAVDQMNATGVDSVRVHFW